MTTTYDSTGPLAPTDDAAYTSLQKPGHHYEEIDAATRAAQTSSPVTGTYESTSPLDPVGDKEYTRIHKPQHDYIDVR